MPLNLDQFNAQIQNILPLYIKDWRDLYREDGSLKDTVDRKLYKAIPTIEQFHQDGSMYRCIVGPVGSGKTTAATFEICYLLPYFCYHVHGYKETKWCVVRNTYRELTDTTMQTVLRWFPNGEYRAKDETFVVTLENGIKSTILFRACDRSADVGKFKSLEITGYWIDESIEVAEEVKMMLKNRAGRFPEKSNVKFGIETTNPPDVTHPLYYQFKWKTPVPGPKPEKKPLEEHAGFWQPPRENSANLRPGYYEDLTNEYRDNPDWIEVYIQGKPGIIMRGKVVFTGFSGRHHVAQDSLDYQGGILYRGWDNSGNVPAACVVQVVEVLGGYQAQVLKEFYNDRASIVPFAKNVVLECNRLYPGAKYVDWADPAGFSQYPNKEGGWTSNALLMAEEAGVTVNASEQNLSARIGVIENKLRERDGLLIDPSCIRIINGLMGGYCYPKTTMEGVYGDKPEKNRFSHIIESLQYVLCGIFQTYDLDELDDDWEPER